MNAPYFLSKIEKTAKPRGHMSQTTTDSPSPTQPSQGGCDSQQPDEKPKRGDRTNVICGHFKPDATAEMWLCEVEVDGKKCGKPVRCVVGNGAPGRYQHLRRCHQTLFAAIPKREVSVVELAKRERDNDTEAVVDWLARRLHSFTELDDEFIRTISCGKVTRRNYIELARTRSLRLLNVAFEGREGAWASFSLDGGTNKGVKTMDSAMVVDGVSRALGAARLPTATADLIEAMMAPHVEEAKSRGLRILGFVSDNASNVSLACQRLATRYGGLVTSCGCHCLQLFVKDVLGKDAVVEEGLQAIEKARITEPEHAELRSIPAFIDSRWNSWYDACEVVSDEWHKYVALKILTTPEVNAVRDALEALGPWRIHTERCEREDANVFDLTNAFAVCLPIAFAKNLKVSREKFLRNCYKDTLLAAVSLFPTLYMSSLSLPVKTFLQQALLTVARKILPDVDRGEELTNEASQLFEGFLQQAWRAGDHTAESAVVDFWEKAPLKRLAAVFFALCRLPASSADVERLFSAHGCLHTARRCRLGEDSVSAQLQLHSLLRAQKRAPASFHCPIVNDGLLQKLIEICQWAWKTSNTATLRSGETICVFMKTNSGLLQGYAATTVEMIAPSRWKVTWKDDKKSQQEFLPLIDDWTIDKRE